MSEDLSFYYRLQPFYTGHLVAVHQYNVYIQPEAKVTAVLNCRILSISTFSSWEFWL